MVLISDSSQKDVGFVTIEGEFDNDQIGNSFQVAVEELINQEKKRMVLDLSKTEIINTYGVGKIFYADQRFKQVDGVLVLKGVHGFVKEILDTLKITQLFTLEG